MENNHTDEIFKSHIREIIEEGISTEGYPTRAKWSDGEDAYTKRIFGVIDTYDLSKEIPVTTLRPLGFKNCIDEILWMYQKKSNNINDLHSHIWDSWADEEGSIGKTYGYQVGHARRRIHKSTNIYKDVPVWYDQTDYVLHEIEHNPTSRRIVVDLYNINQLHEMNLDPCVYSFNIFVDTVHKKLNMMLYQRSQDYITANNWDVVQYAILLHMFAIHTGYKVGILKHCITDCHIYDRHFDIAKELLQRESYEGPTLWINPEKKNFYDFTVDDFKLINYKHGDKIKIPVAI